MAKKETKVEEKAQEAPTGSGPDSAVAEQPQAEVAEATAPDEVYEPPNWEREIDWETWCHPNLLGRAIQAFFVEVRRDVAPEYHKSMIPLFTNPIAPGQPGVITITMNLEP
ncbi:MAG: hypothetical protein GY757_53705 [bacterium]|nr:hypothetical protein [bacterium]